MATEDLNTDQNEAPNADTTVETAATDETKQTEGVVTSSDKTTEEDLETSTSDDTTDSDKEPSPDRVVPDVESYNLPEGVPRSVAEFANKNDMTQEQLDSTITEFSGYMQAQKQHEQDFMLTKGTELVDSWGDSKESNLGLVKRALEHSDPDGEFSKVLNETGYGNHPVMLKFLLAVGKTLEEGGYVSNATTPKGKPISAATAMFGKSHSSKH